MSDYIDRRAAVDAMCELMDHWFGADSKDEKREIKMELGKLTSVQTNLQPTCNQLATDCISRKAAVDEIEMLLEQSEDDEHDKTWNDAIKGSITAIKHHVPSVQPETEERTGESAQNVPKDELISKKVAIDSDALWNDLEILYVHNKGKVNWNDALLKIKNAPTIEVPQRWIPVTEALPERGKEVLVTRDYAGRKGHNKSCRYVETASRYGEDDDVVWNSYSDEYKMHPKSHRVVAWMPLPECYKGEQE